MVAKAVSKIKKSKPGARMVLADDLQIQYLDDNGEEQIAYPHYGEAVWFKNKPSVGQFNEFLKFQHLFKSVSADEDGATAFLTQIIKLASILEGAIVRWNWTDDNDELYPEHPTAELLSDLSLDEIAWLMAAFSGSNKVSIDERKKD